MKSCKDLTSLPVLAIAEGDFVGRVHSPVINPAEGKIDYLLLEGKQWYLEKNAISFADIAAIGKSAVTTEKAANIKPVSQLHEVLQLLQKNIAVLNSPVMTRDGRLIGTVSEIYFDETSGKITGCELTPEEDGDPAGIIPAGKIITFGQKYLVVTEDADSALVDEPDAMQEAAAVSSAAEETAAAGESKTPAEEDSLKLFEEKQRQYLIGKRVSKTIFDSNGNIVASEGTVVTEDIIDRATRVDKYVELTMFVE